jgi:hypothetical protein
MRPLKDFRIQPGLYTVDSDLGAGKSARWKDGDKVRFHNGFPQKIGGWLKSGLTTFIGKCRSLTDWQTVDFVKYIGLGTHLKLYVWCGGTYYDITPIRSSGTLGADPFATTNGSPTVTVTHAAHGASVGDYVTYGSAAAVAGITIDGEYAIATIVDANTYTITHSANANATTTGGGAAVTYEYQINVGSESSLYGLGWGAGQYSTGTYSTPRTVSSFLTAARIWSLDQWGEDLIACPRGKAIYVWDASVGTGTRAAVIAAAPATARAVLVSPQNQHLIALGAHNGSTDDPLLIRWCSSENYTLWTPGPENSAGQKKLNTGNEILCGVKANKDILVFTDSHLWTMRFIGPSQFFSFNMVGENGGLAGPNAAIEKDGVVYWMGNKNFYYYNGAVNVLPCEVWPTVFDDRNFVQRFKVFASVNRDFNEVWWLYCSAGSDEVDRYVIYQTQEKVWSFGTLVRTAMMGNSDIFIVPFATGTDGYLYDHETGEDDDTSAMTAYLESGDVEIAEGDRMMHIGAFVPDFKQLEGSIALTLTAKKYAQDSDEQTEASITITSATKIVNPRIKGRQVALKLQSSSLGDHWRLGQGQKIGVRPRGGR